MFATSETPDLPISDTPHTHACPSRPSRKRKIDEHTCPDEGPSKKRVATATVIDDDDVISVGPSSQDDQDLDNDDYINRPLPDQDWGDHKWRSDVVSKLIAASPDVLSLFPKGKTRGSRIHKELLCYYSIYYRNLLSSHFNDSKTRRSFWAETTQSALTLFVKWLYTRDLTDARGEYNWNDLAELYMFANSSLVLALRRDIMTVLHADHHKRERHWFFAYSVIAKVYQQLPADSPLRSFIVSTHIQHWSPDVDTPEVKRERAAQAPPDFLFAVMEGQAGIIRYGDNSVGDLEGGGKGDLWCCGGLCQFHEHEDEVERAATCGLPYRRSIEDGSSNRGKGKGKRRREADVHEIHSEDGGA